MSGAAQEKPIVVFDTTVVFAATFNPNGVAARALALAEQGEIALVVSNRLRSEYEETITHPALLARLTYAGVADVRLYLDHIDRFAERIANPPVHLIYPRDPDDEHIVNLVIETGAAYLVTLDKDLLALAAYPPFQAQFRAQVRSIEILRPGDFLTEIERRRSERERPGEVAP